MKQKLTTLAAHLAAWLLFFSLVLGFVHRFTDTTQLRHIILSVPFLFFAAIYLLVFYGNTQLLISWLYLRRRYAAYTFSVIVMLITVAVTRPFDNLMNAVRPGTEQQAGFRRPDGPPPVFQNGERPPPPQPKGRDSAANYRVRKPEGPPLEKGTRTDILSIVIFIAVWSLGTATSIIRQWRQSEQRASRAEAEKISAELSFLKAQINPHFLFNTLNNIYSLALAKSGHTAAGILKLSNIMRYVTDDVTRDFVPLEDEMACISDYIDLQKMRLGGKTKIDFTTEGSPSGKMIAPLLWMTFVENAFKYGISNHEPAVITIRIQITAEQIAFQCGNAIFERRSANNRSGLGIANARQRLQHLYPGRHQLDIRQEDGKFRVHLILSV
ncbi:MAG TPA: sensor histidine kinase [Chitinophagaceae bacterium]|nr:sensor histidine kinase [Chitinophagaceae bacterium]